VIPLPTGIERFATLAYVLFDTLHLERVQE
jgi:hypothetical protein